MGDTDATTAPADGALPAAVSISSIPADQSRLADPVTALGEQILAELGGTHTNNTLTRWLAHHTAALLHAAEHARKTSEPDADARAADARTAILQLWQHRQAWLPGWPPPRAAAVAQLLNELPDLDDPQFYRGTTLAQLQNLHYQILAALVDLATSVTEDVEQGWLERFGEHLTADEAMLLARTADSGRRLGSLFRLRGLIRGVGIGDDDADEVADDAGQPDIATVHPLAQLVDVYRKIVLNALQTPKSRGGDEVVTHEPVSPDLDGQDNN
ncbi:hypothetical protein AB0K35_25725 [Micromonospora sp. NPDC053740]|uniref:hypothetical protein n=1 Tax=Micromonospora sp. NPDC053740 TaxID=3155173 RepID=UPI003448F466